MTWPFALIASAIAWLAWLPAAGLERAARGDHGGVSVFPAVPCFPLATWGAAYWADQAGIKSIGIAVVVGHVMLLIVLLASIVKSRRRIRERKEQAG